MPLARFCSACGTALPAPPPVVCSECGTSHWRNASPGACAVVGHHGRVLLVRRAHDPWRDQWSAPGGFCLHDEHPIDAAVREVHEETGVAVRVVGFIGIWIDQYADAPSPDDDTISVVYYAAEPVGDSTGTPDGVETAEARWFAWEELPLNLAPPGTLEAALTAWRDAFRAGRTATPLPDRPA